MPEPEQWFYENWEGHQTGPVSPTTLEDLRARGTITPATRVWQKGLPDWQAMHSIDPGISEKQLCAECGAPHEPRDLLQYGSVPICAACKDTVVQKLQLGGRIGQGFWQDGKFLIAEDDRVLPQRCFKCNAPAKAVYHKKLSWVPWWPGLIFMIGILAAAAINSPHPFFAGMIAYIIGSRIVRKKSGITVHLCYAHAKKRLIAFVALAVSAVVAPVALVSGSLIFDQPEDEMLASALFAIGGLALFVLLIANWTTNRLVTLKSVEEGLLILGGAGLEFLASLPLWHGLRSDR